DAVMTGATGELVVAEQRGVGARRMVEEGDVAADGAVEVDLERRGDVRRAAAGVERRAGQRPRVERLVVGTADDGGVVAGDGVVAAAAVDDVRTIRAAGDVVAADQVIVTFAAEDRVAALAADGGVRAGARVDGVV